MFVSEKPLYFQSNRKLLFCFITEVKAAICNVQDLRERVIPMISLRESLRGLNPSGQPALSLKKRGKSVSCIRQMRVYNKTDISGQLRRFQIGGRHEAEQNCVHRSFGHGVDILVVIHELRRNTTSRPKNHRSKTNRSASTWRSPGSPCPLNGDSKHQSDQSMPVEIHREEYRGKPDC